MSIEIALLVFITAENKLSRITEIAECVPEEYRQQLKKQKI